MKGWGGRTALLAAVLALAVFGYGALIEPSRITVSRLTVSDDYFGRVLAGKTVVQLSDLHLSGFGAKEERLLRLIAALDPDLIFLTGDYVQWNGDFGPALAFLSRLKAKIGVWGVLGDYDYSESRKTCLLCHEAGSARATQAHSVRFLRNTVDELRLPEGTLTIAGMDLEGREASTPEQWARIMRLRGPALLLSHTPFALEFFRGDERLFILAGDTHGGQIALPVWVFKLLGYEKNIRYNQGMFRRQDNVMYVSRGIGTSHVPLRLFRPPEVVVLHFVLPSGAEGEK